MEKEPLMHVWGMNITSKSNGDQGSKLEKKLHSKNNEK